MTVSRAASRASNVPVVRSVRSTSRSATVAVRTPMFCNVTGSISTTPGAAPLTETGWRSMPQIGHWPGSSWTMWGCIPDW